MVIDVAPGRVREWMIPSPVITPRTSVATSLRLLQESRLPVLPVSEGERFVGVVHEKDLLRLTPSEATTLDVFELRGLLAKLTVARVVRSAVTVPADATLNDAAALMLREEADAVAVTDGGRLVGLLTRTALLAALAGLHSASPGN